jgi:hypothetical protein
MARAENRNPRLTSSYATSRMTETLHSPKAVLGLGIIDSATLQVIDIGTATNA